MKKIVNLWKSTLTGNIYQAPADWLPSPQFMGWELLATVEVDA